MSAAYPATQEKSSSSKDFVRQLTLGRGIANSNMIPFQEDIKRLVRENSEWAILGDFLDDGAYYEIPEPEKQRAEKEPSEPVPKKETREEMVARETREIARAKSHIDFQKSLDEQWKIRYTNWVSQISKTDQAKRTLWMFIMSRIDENTKELLKADDSWRTIDKERSPLTLMKLIEKIHLQPRPGVEVRDSFLGLEHLMETKMFPTESLAAFAKRFQNRVEHTKRLNAPQFDEKLLAYMFLARLDNTRYSQVRLHLDHKADSGIKYPETIQAMQLSVARWEETQAASSAPKASFVVTGATPEDPPNDSPNRQKRGGKGNGQGKEKKRLKEEGEKYCHFCQLSSHSTTDCRKMAKAKRDFGQGKGGGGGGRKGGRRARNPFASRRRRGRSLLIRPISCFRTGMRTIPTLSQCSWLKVTKSPRTSKIGTSSWTLEHPSAWSGTPIYSKTFEIARPICDGEVLWTLGARFATKLVTFLILVRSTIRPKSKPIFYVLVHLPKMKNSTCNITRSEVRFPVPTIIL